jgi:hypothetical protein
MCVCRLSDEELEAYVNGDRGLEHALAQICPRPPSSGQEPHRAVREARNAHGEAAVIGHYP